MTLLQKGQGGGGSTCEQKGYRVGLIALARLFHHDYCGHFSIEEARLLGSGLGSCGVCSKNAYEACVWYLCRSCRLKVYTLLSEMIKSVID